MASLRAALLLAAVALALVALTLAAPQPEPNPLNLGKIIKNAVNKVKKWANPTLQCLSDAGAGEAALGYLKQCGQTYFYGKLALLSCATTTYAPADVKSVAKYSSQCFK